MGFMDMTDAEMRALTRLRRLEARERRPVVRYAGPSVEYEGAVLAFPESRTGRSSSKRYRGWKVREWTAGRRHCAYCGTGMQLKQGFSNSFTVDHKEPVTLGGDDEPWNWAGACLECNGKKGSLTEGEFRALVA